MVRDCRICRNAIAENASYVTLPCQHIFHLDCLEEYMSRIKPDRRCPLCDQKTNIFNNLQCRLCLKEIFKSDWEISHQGMAFHYTCFRPQKAILHSEYAAQPSFPVALEDYSPASPIQTGYSPDSPIQTGYTPASPPYTPASPVWQSYTANSSDWPSQSPSYSPTSPMYSEIRDWSPTPDFSLREREDDSTLPNESSDDESSVDDGLPSGQSSSSSPPPRDGREVFSDGSPYILVDLTGDDDEEY